MNALEFRGVSVRYQDQGAAVLKDASFAIEYGELAVVVGRTGSGKSTLLGAINGLVPHLSGGVLTGQVLVAGHDTADERPRDLATVVGVVGQDPLAGFVTDTVEEELAYGMEQLGLRAEVMRKRVEEVLDVLGIADLRDRPLRKLSGGQQQRVAIGSVLTTHPKVLVLDEPTSALDPTGAEEVLATVTRLVHDLGVTVILAEHRLERVLQYADVLIEVDDAHVRVGAPSDLMVAASVAPPVVQLGRLLKWEPLPLSVRNAQRRARTLVLPEPPTAPETLADDTVSADGITVRYADVVAVSDVSLSLAKGEVVALMGRNGSGKSSLLWALQGSGSRAAGRVTVSGVDPASVAIARRRELVGLVPQTPADLLYLPSVGQECAQADRESNSEPGRCRVLLDQLVPGVADQTHPRDLSEGQRLALVLAIQLTADPQVLLLDEPTRGLDYPAKEALGRLLGGLQQTAVLLSTHDVEFVAQVADRVMVMAQGEVVASGPTTEVVVSSPAYAPQVAKIIGHGYLTVADVAEGLGGAGD